MRVRFGSAAAAVGILVSSVAMAPSAVADPVDSLRGAVLSARGPSCGNLTSDPLLEQAAAQINKQTDRWLDEDLSVPPTDDPLPLLKDLGYGSDKVRMLQGAGFTDANAIKGLLLQGYLDLTDCAYTKYGANVVRNYTTNYFLATVMIAA